MQNSTVTFHLTSYKSEKRQRGFNIPVEVARFLDLPNDSEVALRVERPSGQLMFHCIAKMTSGTEITAAELCRRIEYGEDLRITASRPPEAKG